MDTISIKDITVFAYHGVIKEENKLGRSLLLQPSFHLVPEKQEFPMT